MATKWTTEQSAAIAARDRNLLLSAAAGSGKTAVLVQRIISRLTDETNPVAADRLLVVTFTNAAAAEMRERIINSLTKLTEQNPLDTFLANQLLLVKKAQITTIDSFCIDTLRKQFVAAELAPDFKIADPTENEVIRAEVMDEVLTEMYDDPEYAESFLALLESYANSKANDRTFRETVDALYLFSVSLPNPESWLRCAVEHYNGEVAFEDTLWYKTIMDVVRMELEKCADDYKTCINLMEADGFDRYADLLKEEAQKIADATAYIEKGGYSGVREQLSSFAFGRRPAVPKDLLPKFTDYVNETRDAIKKNIRNLVEKMMPISYQEQETAVGKMRPLMACLAEIVIRISRRFSEYKLSKNMLDFNDCEHLCLRLLTDENGNPSETAEEIRKQFDEIYIDEYQDTSRLQEAIFAAIRREDNLFMVGDIKQSIYRFRNSDPSLFKEKRDGYEMDEQAKKRKIVLSKNFRSRENVLSTVNFLFERIMSESSGEIDYDEHEKLYPGAHFPEDGIHPVSSETELHLIDASELSEEEDDATNLELEAVLTANRITELIEQETRIADGDGYRKIRYSDICIISRSVKDTAQVFAPILSAYGIPCYAENTGGFLESSEVSAMMAFLAVIDNPYQDIPLLAVLRSALFRFTADALAKIRSFDKRGRFYDAMKRCATYDTKESAACCDFLETLQMFREKSSYMSVSELVMEIYQRTGFYDAQQTQPGGVIRRANLRLLHKRAREFEHTRLKGLYHFIQYITDYAAAGGDFGSAKTIGAEQDAVRVMSIHKSKGLEFPIVILVGIEKKFNIMDMKRPVLYHMHLGLGPRFVDTTLRITYPFAPRVACETVLKRESIAEEMRILYVAMTRAKEKLIMIGASKQLKNKVSRARGDKAKRLPAFRVLGCGSYLEWILEAFINHPDCDALRDMSDLEAFKLMDDSRIRVQIISDMSGMLQEPMQEETEESTWTAQNAGDLISLVKYRYPRVADTLLPSKITVTELKRKLTVQNEEESVMLYPPMPRIHRKGTSLTAAEVGTAYHTVLEKCVLSASMQNPETVKQELERLTEAGYLTEEERDAVDAEKIAAFFLSDAGKMLLSAKCVRREVMFAINRPANSLLPSFGTDQDMMLQGIIDCVAETDDGLVILDYKTDRTEDVEKTAEQYRVQLACYRMAAEQIFAKTVKEKLLYLFDKDITVRL